MMQSFCGEPSLLDKRSHSEGLGFGTVRLCGVCIDLHSLRHKTDDEMDTKPVGSRCGCHSQCNSDIRDYRKVARVWLHPL